MDVSKALHIIGMFMPKLGLPTVDFALFGAGFSTTGATSAARSHDPFSWERATEKNKNTGMESSGRPSSRPCRGRHRATARGPRGRSARCRAAVPARRQSPAGCRPCGRGRSCSHAVRPGSCQSEPETGRPERCHRARPAWTAPPTGWRTGNAGPPPGRPASSPRPGRPVWPARCWDGRSAKAWSRSSFQITKLREPRSSPGRFGADALEAGIVIVGVITNLGRGGRRAAADEAAGAAVACARGFDRVFAIEAACLAGQQTFAVAEHHAVLAVRKRAAGQHEPVRFLGLGGQLAQRNFGQSGRWGGRFLGVRATGKAGKQQGGGHRRGAAARQPREQKHGFTLESKP
mmetsp:Transcript_49602/g.116472  ORF Transcript_49602/g.116472 Transcript_49602/m.116472 type:complete len:347 (-) Transcript_49602:1665-2705(-)